MGTKPRLSRLGDPKISLPVGFVFYQPAPELSVWSKQKKALGKQGVPETAAAQTSLQSPVSPKEQLALGLLEAFKAQHPHIRVHCIMADALYGTATFVDGASAIFGGVQVLSQIRSNQNIRVGKRAQHVAAYCATHPGTPQRLRIRGGQAGVATVGSARLYVCSTEPNGLLWRSNRGRKLSLSDRRGPELADA